MAQKRVRRRLRRESEGDSEESEIVAMAAQELAFLFPRVKAFLKYDKIEAKESEEAMVYKGNLCVREMLKY